MTYAEIRPTAALQPWVECFWTQCSDAPAGERRILPDGCADLVFDLDGGDATVVGTMTRPFVLPPSAQSRFFGVRFHPGRAAAFLRIPLAEVTDAHVPLRDVWKQWDGNIDRAAIEAELLRRLDPERDRRVDAAVAEIIRSGGSARIDELAREIGISRQHLARQFQQHLGVAPKTFARVMRFRRLLASLPNPSVDWADVAAQYG
ncbi:MAG: AraC family transcriptional regulator, partial [Acidobacteriota bacterium]|nr:AraC family transcriptional regulator [Acidobacteriota bacterium]